MGPGLMTACGVWARACLPAYLWQGRAAKQPFDVVPNHCVPSVLTRLHHRIQTTTSCVCVCPVAGALSQAAPHVPGGAAAAKAKAPQRKPKTLMDFAAIAAAKNAAAAGTAGAAAGAAGAEGKARGGALVTEAEGAALLAGGSRQYVLVQRPQGGLLAGLWEFPGGCWTGG